MKATEAAKVFLLGVIACALTVLAAGRGRAAAWAGDAGGMAAISSGGLMAMTGPERATLFLVDPEGKYLAQYAVDANNKLALKGVRYFKYDMQIGEFSRPGTPPLTTKDAKDDADAWIHKLDKLTQTR